MPIDLRYAGLDAAMEQRLRLAANALAAHKLEARATQWDGTRCDVVAADPGDAYGRRVLDIARKRGTPALEVGTSVDGEPGANVARLTRALHTLLTGGSPPAVAAAPVSTASAAASAVAPPRSASPARPPAVNGSVRPAAGPVPRPTLPANADALSRLALDPSLEGYDLEARVQSMTIWIMRSSGRVLSATVSDQLRARERLGTSNWTFTPLPDRPRQPPPGEVTTSLDAFLLQGAWQARANLPAYPEHPVSLRDWPDLGAAAKIVEALAVLQVLQRSRATPSEISRRCSLASADVSACLWAFKAAELLVEQAPATAPPPEQAPAPPRPQGLFSRLANHFGLFRS
jgi:hypothetical protein